MIALWILKNPCISGINPACSCCTILLMYCWIQFASMLLRVFMSMVIYNIGLFFFSLVISLSRFGLGVMASWHGFGSIPPCAVFGRV